MLFKDIHISLPVVPVIWCDNVNALALASNPVYHARTKYIEVDYHFVRDKVINRDISVKFIPHMIKCQIFSQRAYPLLDFLHSDPS
jgi:hypothetical protein